LAFIRGSLVRIFRIEIHFDDLKWWRSPRSLQKSGALCCVSNSCEKHVSPSGLEDKQNQSPVADATGNDVSPSGLFVNFNNRFDHITRNVLRKLKTRRQKSWEYRGSTARTQKGKICQQLTITKWWYQTTQPLSNTEAVSVFHRLTKVVKSGGGGNWILKSQL